MIIIELSIRLLKNCAKSLAMPIIKLARLILTKGSWPECWKLHWIYALFKKGLPWDANHYRGIHPASNLAKFVEIITPTKIDFEKSTLGKNNKPIIKPNKIDV